MGQIFSSNQLAGETSSGIPTISYAYSTGNAASFGVDATFSEFFIQGTVYGKVTPYLVQPNPASPTITCTPFSASSLDQSLLCPIAATLMEPGLYTISFSQYESTTMLDASASTYFTYQVGDTITSLAGEATFSIIKPQVTTTTTVTTIESSTQTSGISEILPTETSYVPSGYTTVTAYYTTIVSTVVSSQTSGSGITVKTVTAACPLKCSHNNCYRGIFSHSADASAFCAAYTTGAVIATLPTYVSKCNKRPASISSACKCVFPTTTPMAMEERGAIVIYAPPDFTFTPGEFDSTTTSTVATTIPSETVTDPPATITSGVSTSTIFVDSTVTITTIISNINGGTTSTVTKPAKNCK